MCDLFVYNGADGDLAHSKPVHSFEGCKGPFAIRSSWLVLYILLPQAFVKEERVFFADFLEIFSFSPYHGLSPPPFLRPAFAPASFFSFREWIRLLPPLLPIRLGVLLGTNLDPLPCNSF